VTCRTSTSAAEVAQLLTRERVGSVIVMADEGALLGVVTDRDLRQKIVGEARDPATPVTAIMSAPVVTTRSSAFAFDAMLEMTRRDIRHLAVVDDGRLIGVISARDLLAEATTHPVLLGRDITRAPSLEALAGFAGRVTALVGDLVQAGTSAYDLGQLVAELNDRLVVRVLGLAAASLEEAGATPPVPFCWLAFGSEARSEQTLRTDQDNGLVYADPPPDLAATAADYFARFADSANQGLVAVGFPRCPANIMASNPQWCQPMAAWTRYFRHCLDEPSPERLLGAAIHFDVRPLGGALELGAGLAELVRREAPAHRLFLALLARDVVDRALPLTLLGRLAVSRRGPHAGTLDVKGGGTMQLVGAGRVLALELGLAQRNTLDRIRGATARGVWNDRQARDIVDAGQVVMRLRLVHQLAQLGRGQPPDNRLVLAQLARADLLLLRDALRTIADVQQTVRGRYPEGIG
jgi:CBS domain-containing protein